MPNTSTLSREERTFREGTTGTYRFQALKSNGVDGIPAAQLTTLTLTLKNVADGTEINGRTDQDIKNANNVTVDADGNIEWEIQREDNIIVDTDLANGEHETHRALFKYTWASGEEADSHEVLLFITALDDIS